MEHKNAIVIDKNGCKVEFVLAAVAMKDGQLQPEPLSYTLKAGESLVFDGVQEALGMLKPRWIKNRWVETATEEELEATKAPFEECEPATPEPDLQDLALAKDEQAAEQAGTEAAQLAAAPVLRKRDLRNFKIDVNTTITIDIEVIKRQLEEDIYRAAGLPGFLLPGC